MALNIHHVFEVSLEQYLIDLCISLFIYFSPADNRIYLFVCSYIREMKIQMEKEDRHMNRLCVYQSAP